MLNDLKTSLRPAIVMTVLLTLLLGFVYPFALTGIGQLIFPSQANGSIVSDKGVAIGSTLIGQGFASPRYFHGRPSAAGKGYDATASSGSNLAPTSKALVDRVRTDITALPHPTPGSHVPADLVTTSASGLDPHISPEAALYQASGVATARGIPLAALTALIDAQTEAPSLGFIGERRVNVLVLNQALDRMPRRP